MLSIEKYLHKNPVFIGVLICVFSSCVKYRLSQPLKPANAKNWDKKYEWKGGNRKVNPSTAQWEFLKDTFNIIPQALGKFDAGWDSALVFSSCYKFIYSPDSTKFIAFYVTPLLSCEGQKMKEGGATFYTKQKDKKTVEFYGATLWGMLYHGRWYYHKNNPTRFCDDHIKTAREFYLKNTLSDIWFFEDWLQPHHQFWKTGGKSIAYLPIRQENYLSIYPLYEGYPVLVAYSYWRYLQPTYIACNEWMVNNRKTIFDGADLNEPGPVKESACNIITFDQQKAIGSYTYEDTGGKKRIGFLYFELENENIVKAVYKWNQPIVSESPFFTNDIYNYLRQFWPNWDYGHAVLTVNQFNAIVTDEYIQKMERIFTKK